MYRIVESVESRGARYEHHPSDRFHVKGSSNNFGFDLSDQFIWDTTLKKVVSWGVKDVENKLDVLFQLMKECKALNDENNFYEIEIKNYSYGTL